MSPVNANGTHHQNGTDAPDRDQAWRDAVDAVTARARNYYGTGLDKRITKAMHYLLDELMEVDGQFGFIPSESYSGTHYTVSVDGCDCQDAEHTAPQGMCAHRLAWDIYRGACRLIREQQPKQAGPPPEPIPDPYASTHGGEPLAEAPISICMKGTLAGVPGTLVTLRGHTMDEIVARAAQVKSQAEHLAGIFDATNAVDDPPPSASDDDDDDAPPLCPDHETDMKRSKFGGWYCPQMIDDNEFCSQKVKGKAKRRRR